MTTASTLHSVLTPSLLCAQVGSEYVAYDSGIAPGKTVDEHSVRRELAGIQFAYGELGPGRMTVRRAGERKPCGCTHILTHSLIHTP